MKKYKFSNIKSILFIYFLFSTLLCDDIKLNKFNIAFSPDFIGLGGTGLNIELFYNKYSFRWGFGTWDGSEITTPIAIYKNIPINNKITDIIGTPEIGLGHSFNFFSETGTFLCTNFKKKMAYNTGYFRYGFYYGIVYAKELPSYGIGFPQIGFVKFLN